MIDTALKPATAWEAMLTENGAALQALLLSTYANPALVEERRLALIATVRTFVQCFGDAPVVVFRAPGRINLRGMHVDTHGGFLNLMTHQRETIVVAAGRETGRIEAVNTDRAFPEFDVEIPRFVSGQPWEDLVVHGNRTKTGQWGDYLLGCAVRLAWNRGRPSSGFALAVNGNVPTGAALSSSSSLCCAVYGAMAAMTPDALSRIAWIHAVRGAEWYAGARIGTSDQGAIILGRAGHVTAGALPPDNLEAARPDFIPFPDDLAILVVNTYTTRKLSGEHLLAYTRNRFAYAMALDVLRGVMTRENYDPEFVANTRTLADLHPHRFEESGGERALFRLLMAVPETVSVADLHNEFRVQRLAEAYETYFGNVDRSERPERIALRGPLLFGIAESLRAATFAEAMKDGDGNRAGQLMIFGHEGDRVIEPDGSPNSLDVSDNAIKAAMGVNAPLWSLPGAYGASSPVLDGVVDAALAGGALGASLTGAGIAGSVLVLCRKDAMRSLMKHLKDYLASEEFARYRGAPLSNVQIAEAIVKNEAVAGAGVLNFPASKPSEIGT